MDYHQRNYIPFYLMKRNESVNRKDSVFHPLEYCLDMFQPYQRADFRGGKAVPKKCAKAGGK